MRPMTASDIDGVYKVAKETWRDTYRDIIPKEVQDEFLDFAYSREMLEKRMKASTMLVADQGETVIGYIQITRKNSGSSAELDAIYILPGYQHVGIGSRMLTEGIKRLNANTLSVVVEKENKKGRMFYEGKGFIPVKEFEEEFLGYRLNSLEMMLKIK
nr:N-acetyltransferase [Bacillus marinisedimentorum]